MMDSTDLFRQMKRNADSMIELGYKVGVKTDPLGETEFHIVDDSGKIIG